MMMNNNNEMNKDLEMNELSIEEMEDVTGGGIKEIVAATTLAAMAMTGNTVSAFGLANALAEDNAHIEAAPEQEAYGAEFAGAMEDEIVAEPVEEVVAASVDEVVEEAAFDLEDEPAAVLTEDGELPEEEAIEELEDADLGELTGVVDADAALQKIVDNAMNANWNEGISVALDAAFEGIAFADGDVLDPVTGELAVGEGEVVRVIADTASKRYSNLTTDQVYGAVSAAVLRATNSGVAAALANDAVVTAMAESEKKSNATVDYMKDVSKKYIEDGIDKLSGLVPGIGPMVKPLLTSLAGKMFAFPKEASAEDKIMAKLDAIEKQITAAEASIKNHVDNVAGLAELGRKFSTVRDTTQNLATRVENIQYNTALSDQQRAEKLAALYDTDAVNDLETALFGATNAYFGKTDFSLEEKSIFDVAYATAVEKVMFSQEALEASAPYMMRLMATYLAGYATLAPIYEAYEQVYGATSLLATRDLMAERMGGVDHFGNTVSNNLIQKYEDYFSKDKYIFVNQGKTTPVKLNRMMYSQMLDSNDRSSSDIENAMKNSVLSQSQIEALAKYCKEKNRTLTQFLFEDMLFTSRYHEEVKALASEDDTWASIAKKPELVNIFAVQEGYLVAGAQSYDCARTDKRKSKTTVEYTYHYRANLIDMDKVGASVEKNKEIYKRCEGKNTWKDFQVIAFQKG